MAAEEARRLAEELHAEVISLARSRTDDLAIRESMRRNLGEIVTRLDARDARPIN